MSIFSEATRRVRLFAMVNGFLANEEILNCPIISNEDFFVGRDTSGMNYSPEELANDMGESEAIIIIDDMTGTPVIIYDEKQFAEMSENEKILVIIHEILHYKEAEERNLKIPSEEERVEDEAELEILSLIITLGYDKHFENARKHLKEERNLKAIAATYREREIGEAMLRKIHTVTVEGVKMRIV